jgi:CRP/FNR family transcriptional regulator
MARSPQEMALDALRDAPFSSALPEDDRRRLAEVAVPKRYQKEAIVFSEGEACEGFYLVTSGVARIFKAAPDGRERSLALVGRGETFAEAALFDDRRYPANAQAVDELEMLFFPRGPFLGLLRDNPEISFRLLAAMSARLKHLTSVIEDLSFNGAAARLAFRLLSEAREAPAVRLSLAKKDLAADLGIKPETLSRLLKDLTGRGAISVDGRTIGLRDRKQLLALAGGGRLTRPQL